ncbi:hypothetical protein RCL1_000817 [Eukaryota sp. TZLM3-RCL]
MSRPKRSQQLLHNREHDAFVRVLEVFHNQGEWTSGKVALIELLREHLNISNDAYKQELFRLSGDDRLLAASDTRSVSPPYRERAPSKPSPMASAVFHPPPMILSGPRFVSPISEGAVHALYRLILGEQLTPQEILYASDAIDQELATSLRELGLLNIDPLLTHSEGISQRIEEAEAELAALS